MHSHLSWFKAYKKLFPTKLGPLSLTSFVSFVYKKFTFHLHHRDVAIACLILTVTLSSIVTSISAYVEWEKENERC